MIVPNVVRQWYDEIQPYLESLEERVKELISPFCRDKHFLYEGRIKTLESLAEKIETGRFSDWEKLDDLFACTIIIPLVTDEPAVLAFLREKFLEIKTIKRNEVRKQPDVFRFDSTRFIGRLLPNPAVEAESTRSVYDYSFEIQIKTVFEFAWSRTTHALTYKGDKVSWERQRLAAHLKAATEQLDMLVNGFDTMSDFIPQGNWPGVSDRIEIEAFFKRKVEEGAIPLELTPKDWTRFVENVYSLMLALTGKSAGGHGARSLGELGDLLQKIDEEISTLGAKHMPRSISLFQFVAGVLGSQIDSRIQKQERYYFLMTDDLKSLYPKINLPCNVFGTNEDEV